MKKSIKIILSLIIVLVIILLTSKTKAAIEANGAARTRVNLIEAYKGCYDMRNPTSSLGVNRLDPHLSTAKDYGAWAYLGLSAYGKNSPPGTLDGNSFRCSTDNATGIKIRANEYEGVACVAYSGTDISIPDGYDTKYMDALPMVGLNEENTKGMAMNEIYNIFNSGNPPSGTNSVVWLMRKDYDYSYQWGYAKSANGSAFRPAIWN